MIRKLGKHATNKPLNVWIVIITINGKWGKKAEKPLQSGKNPDAGAVSATGSALTPCLRSLITQ
jgi:hypothetical protein